MEEECWGEFMEIGKLTKRFRPPSITFAIKPLTQHLRYKSFSYGERAFGRKGRSAWIIRCHGNIARDEVIIRGIKINWHQEGNFSTVIRD